MVRETIFPQSKIIRLKRLEPRLGHIIRAGNSKDLEEHVRIKSELQLSYFDKQEISRLTLFNSRHPGQTVGRPIQPMKCLRYGRLGYTIKINNE